jgi:hypothetical protein
VDATNCGTIVRVSGGKVRFGVDGSIAIEGDALRAELARQAGEYRIEQGPAGMLLLARISAQGRPRGRVLMMGELISRMTVVEIINVVTSTNWRGELHIVGPYGRRVLTVDQGALKHAQTDFEAERLGEVLLRAGLLERDKLTSLLAEKSPEKRFGQMLVERSILDQGTLFKQLQNQAETVFYASLLEERGVYWFVVPPEDAPAPPTTVHLPIQALLMEGVQRIDEMALFRERIPHNRFFPFAVSNPQKSKLDALEPYMIEQVLSRCDGSRSIDDLARESGLGEFPVLKAVYNLQRTGLVQLRRGPMLDTKIVQRLVRQFNDVVRDIFMVVATYGRMEATSKNLSAWLEKSPHATFVGKHVDFDGTLDPKAVVSQLQQENLDDPMQQLHQSLHELAAYALFLASSGLPRHEEQALARDVNHRLKQMRL